MRTKNSQYRCPGLWRPLLPHRGILGKVLISGTPSAQVTAIPWLMPGFHSPTNMAPWEALGEK